MPLIQIGVDIHLADVVEEVEIEAIHPAFFQLLLEDLLHPVHIGEVVAGEFVREEKAVPRVAGKQLPHDELGPPAVIAPRGVEIVDSPLDRVIDHFFRRGLVDPRVVPVDDGQAHGAQPERGELQILKVFVDHVRFPLSFLIAGFVVFYSGRRRRTPRGRSR